MIWEKSNGRFLTPFTSVLLIIGVGFIIYSNCFQGEFVWDDTYLIKNNVYIRDWSNIFKIFTQDIGRGAGVVYGFYRPLLILSFMVDYHLWGLNIAGYHLVNLLLHISVAIGFYWLVRIVFNDYLLAFFSSLLFVMHPVHTEVVMWTVIRADSMSALFMLLALIFYVNYLSTKRKLNLFFIGIWTVFALLSKESSIILPLLLLLSHCVLKRKVEIFPVMSVFVICLLYVILRIIALSSPFTSLVVSSTLWERIPGFFAAVTNYFVLLIFPYNLRTDYGNYLFSFTHWKVMTGIIIVISSLIYGIRRRKISSLTCFSVGWFFLSLLPVSGLYPLHSYMAERWLYIPSMGIFLLVGKGLCILFKDKRVKIFVSFFIVVLFGFYYQLMVENINYWNDKITFYERIVHFTPDNARAYNNLGNAYWEKGNLVKAAECYKKAIKIAPRFSLPYSNLGSIYLRNGDTERALVMFKKALALNPRAKTYNKLGELYMAMNKIDEAEKVFQKAIKVNPYYVRSYFNLGNVYLKKNDISLALKSYQKTVRINPYYAPAYAKLAYLYYLQKEYGFALKYCTRALELGYRVDPHFVERLKSIVGSQSLLQRK